ncbi:probable WRKY transcription factor 20 [Cynara cardunculus var. scolymus]|uniref:probable WRKY transcription factor 20 n=1 Tax=Cynara cardunculus var. scolymus TaxID=59895 RepID=UPI000D62EB7E|nr:probable WRKY transcription factor 20 [Cynara cardunculus var. scolymus]
MEEEASSNSHCGHHLSSGGDAAVSTSTGGGGARYKLMSPAKLPISSSTSITIPHGLSPTSFLDSPILLTNVKPEPSPTTGFFLKSQLMQRYSSSAAFLLNAKASAGEELDVSNSSLYESRQHMGSAAVSGCSSAALQVSAGFNLQQSEPSGQKQNQSESRPNALSSLTNCEMAAPKEQSLAAPVCMLAPGVAAFHGETNGVGVTKSRLHQSDLCHKDAGPLVLFDRSSDDGYNWRKYGQKVVKGSEFPRSYYRCTHPNCEAKKIFECSYTGQITEIIYKGTHDHPKPQPNRRFTAGALMSIQDENDDKRLSVPGQVGLSATSGQVHNFETCGTPLQSPNQANDNMDGTVPQLNITNDEVEDNPNLKRRRTDFGTLDVTAVVKPIREPRVVVQTISEIDILDDGYRWRKYGQKVVRGNPNPRSYYKCTSAGCSVRKHVERASHDPKAVITTYEGKHNHDLPTAKSSNHDIAGNGNRKIRSEAENAICLDLIVGNRFSGKQPQALNAEAIHSQEHASNSSFNRVFQSACYGMVNGGIDVYGYRENEFGTHSFDIATLNHSSDQYPRNLGRVLLGP